MARYSIVIPVYGVAQYLRECLESVISQSEPDWEAICVDDGSSDGSGLILDEYAAKDDRFCVIHQINAGVSVARNMALERARGEWVVFIDADDALHPDWLSAIDRGSKLVGVDWIRLGFSYWNPGKEPEFSGGGAKDVPISVFSDISTKWKIIAEGTWLWRNAYRRLAIGQSRFKQGLKLCEDALFEIDVLPQTLNVCVVPFNGYYYRTRQDSAIRSSYDEGQIALYLAELTRILKCQLGLGWQIPSADLSYRVAKDIQLHFGRIRSGVPKVTVQAIMRQIDDLRGLGVFQLRHQRISYAYAWWLGIKTANISLFFVNGWFWGVPKYVFYKITGDIRCLTDTRRKVKELFSRGEY